MTYSPERLLKSAGPIELGIAGRRSASHPCVELEKLHSSPFLAGTYVPIFSLKDILGSSKVLQPLEELGRAGD